MRELHDQNVYTTQNVCILEQKKKISSKYIALRATWTEKNQTIHYYHHHHHEPVQCMVAHCFWHFQNEVLFLRRRRRNEISNEKKNYNELILSLKIEHEIRENFDTH